MPKYQAPEHVSSVSAAGVEYVVENGQIEAPLEIQSLIYPVGFILLNEDQLKAAAIAEAQRQADAEKLAQEAEQRKADELAKAELATQKKAEADAKKQAAAAEKERLKAEADAKAAADAEAAKNTPPDNQE